MSSSRSVKSMAVASEESKKAPRSSSLKMAVPKLSLPNASPPRDARNLQRVNQSQPRPATAQKAASVSAKRKASPVNVKQSPTFIPSSSPAFEVEQPQKPAQSSSSTFAQEIAKTTFFVRQSSQEIAKATFFVKVKNGIAHIVGDFGGARLYIQTRVGEACGSTKVWMLGYVKGGQEHLKSSLELTMLLLSERLAPVTAKVNAAAATTKAKTLSVTAPVYAKVVDGVLHVQATLGNSKVYIQEKASGSWSKVSAHALTSYSMAYGAVEARARPVCLLASSKVCSAKATVVGAAQPYWIRACDGALYIQAAIGNTLVRIKVASNDRLLAPVLSAYASMYGAVDKFTAPLLARAVSVFDNAKAQLHQLLAPYLEKGQSMATYTRTTVNNMIFYVKVRVSKKLHSLQDSCSICYVKFKNGYVYIRGLVGAKVLYVKVSLAELTNRFAATLMELGNNAQLRALTAKTSVQGSAVSAVQIAKCKASVLSSKAGVMVADRNMQVTAAGAVGGGATGLATGSVAGAVVGIVPAFFTFGLSIPLFATVGGVAGLCTGTLAGGATARKVHAHKDDIKSGLVDVMSKASGGKEYIINKASGGKHYVSMKAKGCTDFVGERTLMVKARLGGTGGTAADSD